MNTSAGDDQIGDAPIFATLAAAVRRHRRWVAATMLVMLAAALVAYLLTPARFTARADVWLDHGFDAVGATAPRAASPAGDALARNTEIRVLNSTDLAGEVVDKLGLANVRGIGQPRDGARVPADIARRQAITALTSGIAVKATGTSYAVVVSYAAPDPLLATGILNQLVDSYVEDRRIGGARGRERDLLRARISAARDAVIRDDAAVSGYRSATELIRKQEDSALIRQEVAALDRELATAEREQTAAAALLGSATARNDVDVGAATSPRLRELRSRQAQQLAARAAAGLSGPLRPESSTIDAGLADLGRSVAAETKRVTKLSSDVRDARARIALVKAARARAKAELHASDTTSAQLAQLERDAKAARDRHAALVGSYGAMMAAQRTSRGTAYVIAHAPVPSARDFPSLPVFALGGLLAALLAAGVVVLVRELSEEGFRTRQDAERKLGLPVIGMVPDLAKVRGADIPPDDQMGPPDYLFNHGRSAFSTAFRSIHAGLRLGGSAHSPRSIAICSAVAGDGKTTVAICLARSAALAGLRVVLVDCDARRQTASKALTPYVEVGLAEVLEDGVEFRRALMRDTPSGAWFLAYRADRIVASGTVSSAAMAALIARLVREFDLVLLDTAPALALVEAREVAAMADAVLLVARWRATPVDAVRIAKELLVRAGAKVAAAALTLVDP